MYDDDDVDYDDDVHNDDDDGHEDEDIFTPWLSFSFYFIQLSFLYLPFLTFPHSIVN